MSSKYTSHNTSTIDDGACIGSNTKIWHYSHVMKGAQIGSDCVLGQNVYIGGKAVVGDRVKIQNNVSVYDSVTIEDDVFCGPSCVFTNVNTPRAFIERKDEFKKTVIKQGASIGANATIICGVTLGQYCLIGAGAVVSKDVPDFALMIGVPAIQTGWVGKNGAVLSEDLRCLETGEQYRLVNDRLELIR